MNNQVTFFNEALLTDATHVGPLARVIFFMSNQAPFFSETLMTESTHVGPPTKMQFFMPNKRGTVNEALVTGATHVGLPVGAHPHWVVKAAFFAERFFANSAAVVCLSGTHFPMNSLAVAMFPGQAAMPLPSKWNFLAVGYKSP